MTHWGHSNPPVALLFRAEKEMLPASRLALLPDLWASWRVP